ncbi:MAG: thermostable hemolysin [Methyloversatilis sp.]|uniref:thermostable hemolysin n=1 Tax=Methyloversatilis sp. TaxID=2569862 RepID=UPI002734C40F|nr:thermostable hemolysin [Methyloversatilis sp.]MDP3871980.1 thermostable hemolysin [Methyloversatilis sp.]
MNQAATLSTLAGKSAAHSAGVRACVLGRAMAPVLSDPALEVVGRLHPERAALERFIAGCFFRGYGAVITHFADTLLGVRNSDGQWAAGLGYSLPGVRPVFIEQYLDVPLESALGGVLGERVARSAVAEVGNMASTSAGLGRLLIALATQHFYAQGLDYVVFTATRALANSFVRLGIPIFPVGVADPARLHDGVGNWGNYYRNSPTVMVGRIASGLHTVVEDAA